MNKYRIGTDVPFQLSVDDGVEYLDLSNCTILNVAMYCDAQEAFAGACTWQLNADDHTRLDCVYPGNRQVYTGVMRAVVVMQDAAGENKAYDLADIFEIVATTEEANATEDTVTSATLSAWQLPMSTLATIVAAAINATEAANGSVISEISYTESAADEGNNVLHIKQADGNEKHFNIKNGSRGSQGPVGPQGEQGPIGPQGNTGSSVDYPFELVNNVTTDDATKALTAAMGVQLEGEITELGQQLNPVSVNISASSTIDFYAKPGDIVKVSVSSVSGRFNLFTEGYSGDVYLGITTSGEYTATILNEGFLRFYMHTAGTLVATLSAECELLENMQASINDLDDGLASAQSNIEKLEGNFEDVVGKNLFDKDQQVGMGYINLYGNITDNTSGDYTYSYQIPIEGNTYYYLTRNISGNSNIRCLDENGTAMKVLIASAGATRSDWALPTESGTSGTASGQFKTPEGAVSVQFNIRWNGVGDVGAVMLSKIGTEYIPSYPAPEYEQYEKSYKLKESALPIDIKDSFLSQLNGKTICIFGGSVSRLCTTFGGSSVMEEMAGVVITNKGHDGGGYAKGTTVVDGVPTFEQNGICDCVNSATQSGQPVYDIYLLWSSTNDLYVTPGDPTDYTFEDNYDVNKLTTQCGGINYCVKKLQEFAPESRIIIVGSLKAVGYTYVSDFLRLQTLVEKQKGVASLQSLPLVSLWDISGVNYYNRDAFFQWTVENEGESRNDGTHPNKWAYKTVIGPKLIKQIALLY